MTEPIYVTQTITEHLRIENRGSNLTWISTRKSTYDLPILCL